MSQQLADTLVERFRMGSTLICGGNSDGKSTLLNALKETLPEDMAVMGDVIIGSLKAFLKAAKEQ